MMLLKITAAISALTLAGCASQAEWSDVSATHPASPQAAEASPRMRSNVLDTNEALASTSAADVPMPDMSTSEHMNHGAGGGHAGHKMNKPNGASAAGAPAAAGQSPAAQPAAGQVLYACPMHKAVTSSNSNDRCPKCKMKINKPVKKAAPSATSSVAPADGNAGHGSEHGGH